MYIENLSTPHLIVASTAGEAQRPLPAVIDALASGTRPSNHDERATLASVITAQVNRTLRFPDGKQALTSTEGTILDAVHMTQVTNCLGYAIVGSECLTRIEERVGPHYVLFANSHAFLGLADESGSRLTSLDPLSPHFDGDITVGLDTSVATLQAQVCDTIHPRGVAKLDTRIFTRAGIFDQLVPRHPWLTTCDPSKGQYFDRLRDGRSQEHSILLSVFEARIGRRVLESYVNFRGAVSSGKAVDAAATLATMHGLYPEIDARAPHREIRRLIGDLCLGEYFDVARQSIASYCASFMRTCDPRLVALEAELLSKLANTSDDRDVAAQAADCYENASQSSSSSWAPTAWASRAERLRAKFALPHRRTQAT